jgi:hypothetical protein
MVGARELPVGDPDLVTRGGRRDPEALVMIGDATNDIDAPARVTVAERARN